MEGSLAGEERWRPWVHRAAPALAFLCAFLCVAVQVPAAKGATATHVLGIDGEGTAGGHLVEPSGVAIDSEGNIWVADTGHNRVQEFGSEGKFLREFGAFGTTEGLFDEPQGIAIDPEGGVWVADTENSRLQKFSTKGELIQVVGSLGSGNAKFSRPQGIVVDSKGNLWIADTNNNRIQELNSKGEFVRKFGTKGTGDGQLEKPQGVALDSEGNVWVADTNNNRIQKFDSEGKFLSKLGTKGDEDGQLLGPQGVAIAEGSVWVADTGNNRLQKFNGEGKFVSKVGSAGNEDGEFSEPGGLTVDSKGNLWVADTFNYRIQEFDAEGEFVQKFGGDNIGAGQLSEPSATAVDSEGNVWVADSGHNRIQEFDAEGKFLQEFGALGAGDGLLAEPQGIALDSEGNVWVADTYNYRIQEFDGEGNFIQKFGQEGTGDGQLKKAEGIALDSEGNVWVADTYNDRIQEFDAEGNFIQKFGQEGNKNGEFSNPRGITFDSKGNIWVADTGNSRLQEFKTAKGEFIIKVGALSSPQGVAADSGGNIWVANTSESKVKKFNGEGKLLLEFGTPGNDSGQLFKPEGIGVDSEGHIWVADTHNDRMQAFTSEGKFVRKFGGDGSGAGHLSEPSDAIADGEGNAWVIDFAHCRVQKFNSKGEFILQFGSEGGGNGQFIEPEGVALDSAGNIWVASRGNHRIQKFNAKGEYLFKFGTSGSESGKFKVLRDLVIDSSDHIWTIESSVGLPRVQEFTSEGKFVSEFGSEGTEDGQFDEPEGIAIDSEGNVWVADTDNNRLQEFTSKGVFIRKVGLEGSGNGQFDEPAAIAIDGEGWLWVADRGNNRVQRFDSHGNYVGKFGTPGNNAGEISEPEGIGVDSEDDVWVADTVNDRVQRWKPLSLPKVTTEGATTVKLTQANLNALVNPEGYATTYWFEYGKTEAYGTKIPAEGETVGSGTSEKAVSQTPTGLEEGVEYHFRAVAENENGLGYGLDGTFRTTKLPDVTTEPATGIKPTEATLKGKVNPSGLSTTYWFEYGETTSYGAKIPAEGKSAGSGTEYVAVSQAPTGLKEGTDYHFRLVAENVEGKRLGEDKLFVTSPPDAATESATAVKPTEATLNGKVNPLGYATTYWFEYGETTSYGTKIPAEGESVGSGTEYVSVSKLISGLKEGTTYHFRVVAKSEVEEVPGEDKSFTALKIPDVTGDAATEIKPTEATLNGKVNPLGYATTYWFEYGETTSYGTKIPAEGKSAGSGTEYVAVNETPTGLKEGTTYHFRVVAESAAGKATGNDKSFTTSPPDAITEAATEIKARKAMLNGKVNPLGNAGTYWFEYGETEEYEVKIPAEGESVGSGTEYVAVSKLAAKLKPGTNYHFRVVIESEAGRVDGEDATFETIEAIEGQPTAICKTDEEQCEEKNLVAHVHEATLSGAKAKLLSSSLNVECDVLFLGESTAELGEPLAIGGSFTYSNCNSGCTATEESGPAEIQVLKIGTEEAAVTGEGLIHLNCSGFINCRYVGSGLEALALGALASSEANGSTTIEGQEVEKESGILCPSTAKLDITTTPLVATYIAE